MRSGRIGSALSGEMTAGRQQAARAFGAIGAVKASVYMTERRRSVGTVMTNSW